MNDINTTIQQILQNSGIPSLYTDWTTRCLILAGILLLSFIAVKLFRHLLIPLLQSITSQTKATWDDHLFNDKILHSANRLIVPIIWYLLLPFAFSDIRIESVTKSMFDLFYRSDPHFCKIFHRLAVRDFQPT